MTATFAGFVSRVVSPLAWTIFFGKAEDSAAAGEELADSPAAALEETLGDTLEAGLAFPFEAAGPSLVFDPQPARSARISIAPTRQR